MNIEGSCHCQKVKFSCESSTPAPFLKCYCSICLKLNGSGGYGINLGADFKSIELRGGSAIDVYQPKTQKHFSAPGIGKISGRHFCRFCSSGLWNWDDQWPELFHPYACVIDTELPIAPAHTHMMLNYKPGWVQLVDSASDKCFDEYPDESLNQWHQRMHMLD